MQGWYICVLHSCSIGPAVYYPARRRGSQGKAGCRPHCVAMVVKREYSEVSISLLLTDVMVVFELSMNEPVTSKKVGSNAAVAAAKIPTDRLHKGIACSLRSILIRQIQVALAHRIYLL